MEPPVVLILILAALSFADQVHSQTIYATENPVPVGSNVTLVSNYSLTAGGWIFNNQHIVLTLSQAVKIPKAWTDRVTFNTNTSSLTIKSLKLEDSGVYSLEEIDVFLLELTLRVQEPVSNVTVQAKAANLVEFNDTAVLMCSVSKGTPLSFAWLNGSSVITANERFQLSNGNTTLTIMNVTRCDHGPYSCQVFNDVSNETSPSLNLTISYGPSNPKMMTMPQTNIYKGGSTITLSCSAESSPPPVIQWTVDGVYLNQTGSNLQLQEAYERNSGNYTCLLHNTVTFRFASATAAIKIVDPVTAMVVSHGPAILGEKFSLLCEVTGTADTIIWWRNGHQISADNITTFSMDKKNLTLNPVLLSHGGHYKCQAFNSVSNMTSNSYTVTVNYGPEMISVMGPSLAKAGDNVTFSCNATSTPPSLYMWYFNDFPIFNASEYVTPALTNMSGQYTCVAFNSITGKNISANIWLRVVDPIQNVKVDAQMLSAKEGHSYNLTCSTNAPADYIYWMKNEQPLHESSTIVFYMHNQTVNFNPVERSHDGNYQCMAINTVSNMLSAPYTLLVNYGPETPIIDGPAFAQTGHQAVFNCSAVSVPPSQFYWWFNGSIVANTSVYTTDLLSPNMSGAYTCVAMNTVTGKNSTTSVMFTVIDPVTAMVVSHGPAILGEKFSLLCEVTGTADTIIWWRNGHQISADNETTFSMDKKNLTLNPVLLSHGGHYKCQAFNSVSNMTSNSYTVTVNYGPEMISVMGPSLAKAGDNVTFSCNATSTPPSLYMWYFNDFPIFNASEYVTPALMSNMSGQYTCVAFNSITGKNISASIWLRVIDLIQNVKVDAQMLSAKEGHSYNLTCSTNAPADYIYWMKNEQPLHESSTIVFYMHNQTVNFNPVERSHDGNYQCMAINTVSNMLSAPYTLLVNYGPETPIIDGPAFAQTGQQAVFNCSAVSVPPSQFYWWFNGSIVANTSVYTTDPLSPNMSGAYTCVAMNTVTGKNSTTSMMFTVIDPIKTVTVAALVMPAIEGSPYSLSCSVTGSADHIYWMKDGERLYEDNRTVSYMNKTVYFGPVERYDTGNYQCMAINAVGNMTSPPFKLIVNYGPETPIIYGPAFAEKGRQAVFNCSAVSEPPSQFCWWFNGSIVANTSVYTTNSLSFNMSGNYTCMAMNTVTGKNSTNSTTLTVIEAIESVKIKNNTIPIDNANFDLTCEVTGPYDMIYWMKDNIVLGMNASSNMSYNENIMLHFTPVTMYSDGTYQCVATNKAGHHVSPEYRLLVNYGPLSLNISRVNVFIVVTLTCVADSRPDCDYYWFFNNLTTPLQKGSMIVFPANKVNEGNYICKAWNPVTNITMIQNMTVTAHASTIHFSYQGSLMMVVLFALSTPMLFN